MFHQRDDILGLDPIDSFARGSVIERRAHALRHTTKMSLVLGDGCVERIVRVATHAGLVLEFHALALDGLHVTSLVGRSLVSLISLGHTWAACVETATISVVVEA